MESYALCKVAANKGAGSQFEGAVKCMGVDLKPTLGIVKYVDFRCTEGRSGLGSAFEGLKKHGHIGGGVRGRYWGWDETHFRTKSISFYDVFGRGLGRGPAEGD